MSRSIVCLIKLEEVTELAWRSLSPAQQVEIERDFLAERIQLAARTIDDVDCICAAALEGLNDIVRAAQADHRSEIARAA